MMFAETPPSERPSKRTVDRMFPTGTEWSASAVRKECFIRQHRFRDDDKWEGICRVDEKLRRIWRIVAA